MKRNWQAVWAGHLIEVTRPTWFGPWLLQIDGKEADSIFWTAYSGTAMHGQILHGGIMHVVTSEFRLTGRLFGSTRVEVFVDGARLSCEPS